MNFSLKEHFGDIIIVLSLFVLACSVSSLISNLYLFHFSGPHIQISVEASKHRSIEPISITRLSRPNFFYSRTKPEVESNPALLNSLSLKGTIICTACGHSIALIEDKNTKTVKSYTVGDRIRGFRIKDVKPNLVVFEGNGKNTIVKLFKTSSNEGTPNESVFSVSRSEIESEISSGTFLRYINIIPSGNGLHVNYVDPRSFIYKFGIRPGDTITSINDIPIKTPEDSFSAFEQLKSSGSVTINIIRNGREVKLHYELE